VRASEYLFLSANLYGNEDMDLEERAEYASSQIREDLRG